MSYFLLYAVFALWVLFDGISRKVGAAAVLWVLGTAILGPIVLPIYLATRPLKEGEVREGGKAWNILKNFAILWTIVMAIATLAALVRMGNITTGLTSDAEMVGAGLGILATMGLLAALWFFPTIGAALLGFLLKKNTIVETGPTGALVGLASRRSAVGGWIGLSGVGILALALVSISSINARLNATRGAPPATAQTIPQSGSNNNQSAIDPTWSYDSTADQMGRGVTKFASLDSVNKVNFSFPYDGGSKAVLTLRNSPKYGKDVIFSVTKGQFLCGVESCRVNVRVEDGKPFVMYANEAADGSSNEIFLPYSTMAGYLKRAKVVRIEANFYNEGSRVFEFHPAGLDVEQLRGK